MDNLHALRVFTLVAEYSSFSRAAERLDLPKASVSSSIQRLEAELGCRLLQRTTRTVSLTPDGELCHRRAKALLEDFDDLRAQLAPGDAPLRGRLRVDMPAAMSRELVLPHLGELLNQNPELEIELSGTDHRVDLVAEGIDCVLRVGALHTSSLVARPLGALRQVSVASPAYLARYGVPATLRELTQHQLVRYQGNDRFEYRDPQDGTIRQLPLPGRVSVGNTGDYQAAGLAGLGLIQVPRYGIAERLECGELVEVLPQWSPPPLPVTLLYAHRRQLPPRSRAFMNWLEELLRPALQA